MFRLSLKNVIAVLWAISLIWARSSSAASNDVANLPSTQNTVRVMVGILPQAYFAEQIGGSHVAVTVLLGPGKSAETYEPTPKEVSQLFDADVYFQIGMPFETRLLEKAVSVKADVNIVDTRKGIVLRPFKEETDHDHAEGEADPHIWLDPQLVRIQAKTMANELKRLDPAHAIDYETNFHRFDSILNQIDTAIANLLAPCRGASFYVFHPGFGYFADRYGLSQISVESEGKEPGAQTLAVLIERAKKDSVKVIFAQSEFSSKTAEAVAAAISAKVMPLDPLARDYLNNLWHIAQALKEALPCAAMPKSANK